MNLEGIMISEMSQRRTNSVSYHSYTEFKKYNKLMNIKKNTLRDIKNILVVTM